MATSKITKLIHKDAFTSQPLRDVVTLFNGASINSGVYLKNTELGIVVIRANISLPNITHDTKIMELNSSEPNASFLISVVGGNAENSSVTNGVIISNRSISVTTTSGAIQYFVFTLFYFI